MSSSLLRSVGAFPRRTVLFTCVFAAFVAKAKTYWPGDGTALEAALVTARADWEASDPKEASVVELAKGTYALTQEMYLDWPVTIVGATGEPDDVVIEGDKTFRILTINHADAEVKDLTIAKGHYANEGLTYNWGNAGVRICKPQGMTRGTKEWHGCLYGSGGKLTHCVVRDCETTYWHSWGIVYLDGPKESTIVDRCVIRNNTHSGQENGQKGKGDIVTVESGIFRNTLVKDNTTTQTHVASPAAAYQGMVTVCGANGEIVGCTVANNYQKNHSQHMVAGVLATAGKVINTVIAGNRIDDPTAAQDRVWHGTASCFVNCVADWPEPINETCAGTTDAGFVDAATGDCRLLTESPAVEFGSTTAATAPGDFDLAGNARLRDDVVDAGAYALTTGGDTLIRFTATPEGVGNEPMRVTLAAFTMGIGAPLTYLWDFDSDGTVDVSTDENVFVYDFPKGKYSVTLTATNETTHASLSVTRENLLDVKMGSGTYEVDAAKDGADSFQKLYDWLIVQDGATLTPQTIVLKPGAYTITNEVMMTWPLTVRGSTGNAADVIIDVENKNKAFCLNHAGARLESLTVFRAKCSGINSYGVVRICNPAGRGNMTNSTKDWKGLGGLVSNVVLNACSATDKFTGHLLLVCADSGVATHCVVTNCSASQQRDGTNDNGMFLQVVAGRADNCLVANNILHGIESGEDKGDCSAAVSVKGGSLVNSTVANNRVQNGIETLCAGVVATGGKVVNTVISANSSLSSRSHYSAWTGTASCFVRCQVDPDYELPNDTCVSAYPHFVAPLACDYRLRAASPCRNAGTNDNAWVCGTTDLAGQPRRREVAGETTIDLGAYQYDESVFEPPTVHYVDANGTNPVSPYDTPETAATDVFAALEVADWGHEVRLLPGVHSVTKSVDITSDHLTVCGSTGDPADVVIRAATSSNRCMKVNAGKHALVHSLTLENGRGGSGGKSSGRYIAYGACLAIANLSQNANTGDDSNNAVTLGGTVSNCIIRGGYFTGKFCNSAGVFAYGPNALVTHCVISNNVSGGFFSDNGCFGATGLCLGDRARAEHCLIAQNSIYDHSGNGYYQAAVNLTGGSVLRYSTVYGNRSSLVGGVNVSGTSRLEKCVIAGNTLAKDDTTDPRHAVWGAFDFTLGTVYYRSDLKTHLADEEIRHANEVVQAQVTTNASDVAEADLGPGSMTAGISLLFRNPARGRFAPRRESPTVDAVPAAAETATMPAADLKGDVRLWGAGYDLGAFEVNYKSFLLLVR